jgi:hypothetical protein
MSDCVDCKGLCTQQISNVSYSVYAAELCIIPKIIGAQNADSAKVVVSIIFGELAKDVDR